MLAYFLFYDIATGKQARLAFSKEFKHCNVVTFDGAVWLNIDFDREGIKTRSIEVPDPLRFQNALKAIKPLSAIIVTEIDKRKEVAWKPFWVRSCNELDRYLTGVDIGFTFNPSHLFNKLLKYDGKRNYQVLYAWRRQYGNIRGR